MNWWKIGIIALGIVLVRELQEFYRIWSLERRMRAAHIRFEFIGPDRLRAFMPIRILALSAEEGLGPFVVRLKATRHMCDESIYVYLIEGFGPSRESIYGGSCAKEVLYTSRKYIWEIKKAVACIEKYQIPAGNRK